MTKKYPLDKYPLLSFVMPVYGDAHTVEEAAHSIMTQDYPNVELILSVDGCKESEKVVKKIVKKYAKGDRRCEALYAEKNRGACIARNEGAKLAKGSYFSFLPADAKLFPGVARVWMKELTEHSDYDFLYGGYRFRQELLSKETVQKMAESAGKTFAEYTQDVEPNPEGKYLGRAAMDYMSESFDPFTLDVANYIDGSFPVKATMFWIAGGWDPAIKSLQDWDLWLSIVKKGGKGLYVRDIFFDTEYPHAGGLSDDSSRNWIERVRQIKKKHGIPENKICVSSLGAPFHGKRVARLLDADFKEMPSFKPHEYELVYLLGFFPSMADHCGQVFQNARGRKVIHWIGSDIWQMQQADLRTRHTLLSFFEGSDITHLCEADFTKQELKELGINAQVVPIPPRFFYKANPLPKKFTVAVYMPNVNQSFYLPEVCKKVTELLPNIEFKFFGDDNNKGKIGNLEYMGKVTDMQKLIDQCSAIMRLTIHDGLPLSVIEFISAGRHALTSCEMKLTMHATTPKPEVLARQLKELQKQVEKKGLDHESAAYYRRLCSHAKYKKTITALAKYDAKEYWDRRAQVWNKQADKMYSLPQADWDTIQKFLKKAKKKYGLTSVIDLGCGNGRFVPMFQELGYKGNSYVGVDISKELIEECKKRFKDNVFYKATVEGSHLLAKFDLRLHPRFRRSGDIDLAFTFTTLEHITAENWPKAIESLRGLARFGLFIEPHGFQSIGHCHDHLYEEDFKVIKKMQIGDKWLFFVDLQK